MLNRACLELPLQLGNLGSGEGGPLLSIGGGGGAGCGICISGKKSFSGVLMNGFCALIRECKVGNLDKSFGTYHPRRRRPRPN